MDSPLGGIVGYQIRLESRVSAKTKIRFVTEGILLRQMSFDATLRGVSAIVFDEFHERSLDADLGLALARDAQGLVREDLKILVMSATLDGARVSSLLGDAPVVESQGRMFPVETRYLGRDERLRLEERVVRAVERALASLNQHLVEPIAHLVLRELRLERADHPARDLVLDRHHVIFGILVHEIVDRRGGRVDDPIPGLRRKHSGSTAPRRRRS